MSAPPKGFELPHLKPKQVMPRNAQCWCQSGKKWKKCHNGRASMRPINVWEARDAIEEEFQRGYCLHPEASGDTCSPIIRAHTIQKKGGLISIAEKNHVLSVVDAFKNLMKNDGKMVLSLSGINKASTFPGFCNKHDTDMFREAETGDVRINNTTAFLLSYRAMAREYFNKDSSIRAFDVLRDGDRGQPFLYQTQYQEDLYIRRIGTEMGRKDCRIMLDKYSDIYRRQSYEQFSYYAVRFDGVIPVVSCGTTLPEYDFEGNSIQNVFSLTEPIEHIAFNMTVLGGSSVVILGWLESGGAAGKLASSFERLSTSDKANAAVRFAFQYVENTYVKPSWWEQLGQQRRDQAINYLLAGLPDHGFSHDALARISAPPRFVNAAVVAEVGRENTARA